MSAREKLTVYIAAADQEEALQLLNAYLVSRKASDLVSLDREQVTLSEWQDLFRATVIRDWDTGEVVRRDVARLLPHDMHSHEGDVWEFWTYRGDLGWEYVERDMVTQVIYSEGTGRFEYRRPDLKRRRPWATQPRYPDVPDLTCDRYEPEAARESFLAWLCGRPVSLCDLPVGESLIQWRGGTYLVRRSGIETPAGALPGGEWDVCSPDGRPLFRVTIQGGDFVVGDSPVSDNIAVTFGRMIRREG